MDNESGEKAAAGGRSRLRTVLFLVVPVVLVAVGAYLFVYGGRFVDTDNAYIKADLVNVGAEVSGKVVAVPVAENQPVHAGDVLIRIDDRAYRVAVDDARAQLDKARIDVHALKATFAQKQSSLAAAEDDLAYAKKNMERVQGLMDKDAVSRAEFDQAKRDIDVARNNAQELRSEEDEIRQQLGGSADIAVDQHPTVQAAQAALDKAQLDLDRCAVRAPIDGIASKVPKLGAYAMPGLPMLSVVANEDTWIEANFKEDQLKHIRVGQPVKVEVDAYTGETWDATVQSLGQATGAEFSLIPPQNATGNWVKVVQRLPVRIRIKHHDGESALRAGLSVDVTIDTGVPPRMKPVDHLLASLGVGGSPSTMQASAARADGSDS